MYNVRYGYLYTHIEIQVQIQVKVQVQLHECRHSSSGKESSELEITYIQGYLNLN